jgi:hypothetical protein
MSKLYGHVWFLKYFENLEIKAGLWENELKIEKHTKMGSSAGFWSDAGKLKFY